MSVVPSSNHALPAAGTPLHSDGHNNALDGIRFFSFMAVFLAHAGTAAEFGSYGVRVFFVLSGFLIGRILLKLRVRDGSLGHKLRTFYIRRTLRIFPLYYAVLTCIWVLPHFGITALGISKAIPWQYFYLNNFYQLFVTMPGTTGHFWTLAIEEQFYLIAPVIILTVPLRGIAVGMIFLWVINLALYILNALIWHWGLLFLLPNIQFGFIAMGVAAAFIETQHHFLGIKIKPAFIIGISSAILTFALVYPLRHGLISGKWFDLFEWSLCITSAVLCLALWSHQMKYVGMVLAFWPLAYLGRISYGLYVYHSFILHLAVVKWGGTEMAKALAFLATIAMAMFSWHLFEKPINELKRFSPYRSSRPTEPASA